MPDTDTHNDSQKKYWWLILIVLPIILALIALVPDLLNKDKPTPLTGTETPGMTQQSENVEQTTGKGHTFSNVQGDITITESGDEEE